MIKKILLIALVALPLGAFAQEASKIAYVNYMDVIASMPEYKAMNDSLKKSEAEYQAELKVLSDEYTKKVSDYVAQQDSLNESIKQRRIAELQDLQQRAQNFQETAAQKQDELQQKLSQPIQEKLMKAVNDVGKENNFQYIANAQAFLYIAPDATDATPLVKKKLGI
jgi:outer membrane protein